jgi:hypothetical protein
LGSIVLAADKISKESQTEALKIARSIQRPDQTKAQTKLVAQGIEKGIAEYKKQQKAQARERDKARKKMSKTQALDIESMDQPVQPRPVWQIALPWLLLAVSCSYILYLKGY